ncbi:MAG TPA: 23S rRNA (guanosine(2251)-2'-O)-methyltransferase RlmB [Nitrospirales bacterium]
MSPNERLYGIHPLLEALRSADRHIDGIYLLHGRQGRDIDEILALAKTKGIAVDFRSREALDRLTGSAHHQGAVGMVTSKSYASLEDLLAGVAGKEHPLLLILDGIEDPHNLGAILRTAEAAGVDGVIIPERRAVGLTATVAKASAGAIEYLPVARVVNLSHTIERLKNEKFWIYALDVKGEKNFLSVDYRGAVALVIGGEGRGIRPLVAQHCDGRINIPMKGKVSSLNASVAAGVLLYEVLRQRATAPPSGPPKPDKTLFDSRLQ